MCPRRVDTKRRAVLLGHPNSVASAATHGPFEGRSRLALTPTTIHTHTQTHTAVHSWIVPSEPSEPGVPPHSQKSHPTPDLRKHRESVLPSAGLGENSPEESAGRCLATLLGVTPEDNHHSAPTFPLSCGPHHLTLVTVQGQTLWLGKVLQDLIPKSLFHLTSHHSFPKPWSQQSICFFGPGIRSPVCPDCWP